MQTTTLTSEEIEQIYECVGKCTLAENWQRMAFLSKNKPFRNDKQQCEWDLRIAFHNSGGSKT